jgi:hypothetical protein
MLLKKDEAGVWGTVDGTEMMEAPLDAVFPILSYTCTRVLLRLLFRFFIKTLRVLSVHGVKTKRSYFCFARTVSTPTCIIKQDWVCLRLPSMGARKSFPCRVELKFDERLASSSRSHRLIGRLSRMRLDRFVINEKL